VYQFAADMMKKIQDEVELPPIIDNQKPPEWTPELKENVSIFIESEKKFSGMLKILVDVYMNPISSSTDRNLIKLADEFTATFKNVKEIMELNKNFVEELQLLANEQKALGQLIRNFVQSTLYQDYSNNFHERIEAAKQLMKKKTFLSSTSPSGHDLIYLLTIPFNRFLRYDPLIKKIINSTPIGDPDRDELNNALKSLLVTTSERIKEQHVKFLQYKVANLTKNYSNTPDDLFAPHRYYIRETEMEVKCKKWKKGKQKVLVLLFNDILMFSKKKGGKLKTLPGSRSGTYSGQILLHNCEISDASEGDSPGIKLKPQDSDAEYVLLPESHSSKNSWREILEECSKILVEPVIVVVEGFVSSQLRVRLLAGKKLQPYLFDYADIQVIFRIGGVELESELKRACRVDPEWRDELIFRLNDIFTEKLSVIVRDLSSNQKLGETTISLDKFFENIEETIWYPLSNSTSKGSLLLSITVGTNLN